MPNNLQPLLPVAKRSILKFAQSQISKTDLRAIELILSPCCDITITGVSQVCVGGGSSATTFTLSSIPNLLGQEVVAAIYFTSGASDLNNLTLVESAPVVGNTVTLYVTLGTNIITTQIVFYLSIAGVTQPALGITGGTAVAIATPSFSFTPMNC